MHQNYMSIQRKTILDFFNLTLACLITALNEVPELRRRIINKQVVEYENISGLTPILQEDKTIIIHLKIGIII